MNADTTSGTQLLLWPPSGQVSTTLDSAFIPGAGPSSLSKQRMIGKRFSRLVVIREAGKNKHKKYIWLVRCDCGNKKIVCGENLRCGGTRSCGCLRDEIKHKRLHNLTGKRFGRLVVLRKSSQQRANRTAWDCICDCGKTKTALAINLKRGFTTSCGCFRIERVIETTGGKNNWNYNHHATPEDRLLKRNYAIPKKVLAKIYKRDNYICKACSKKVIRALGGPIAHHLNGWNWFKKGRSDLSNIVTICRRCHEKFHKMFGYGNNTKEQFDQFRKEI